MAVTIHLGFEVGTGEPISVPTKHLCVCGQTQESGKTTTLEALVSRSGLKAIAFRTKRHEGAFAGGRRVAPILIEHADWRFVSAVLESHTREKMKRERPILMELCKGAKTLQQVHAKAVAALKKARPGWRADMLTMISAYFEELLPEVEGLAAAKTLTLADGLNVMDLVRYSSQLQGLVIRSVLEWVYQHETNVITVIPEAWEFAPQSRSSPVLLAMEELARKGGAGGNYLWLDAQDLAAVNKVATRGVAVYLLGVQREINEVERTLKMMPGDVGKPTKAQVMALGRGQFYLCHRGPPRKVYVQPAWMAAQAAEAIALGEISVEQAPRRKPSADHVTESEVLVTESEANELKRQNAELRKEIKAALQAVDDLRGQLRERASAPRTPDAGQNPCSPYDAGSAAAANVADEDALFFRFRERLLQEPEVLRVVGTKPAIQVSSRKARIEVDHDTLMGRLAGLISKGWFDRPQTGPAAYKEMKAAGFTAPNVAAVVNVCRVLAKKGFLREEDGAFTQVPGMEVSIVEVD